MDNQDLNQFRTDINQVDGLVGQCIELMEDTGVDYEANYERIYELFNQVQTEITNFQESQKWI